MSECAMGFAALFELAKRRPWTPTEKRDFEALDQTRRNDWVDRMAREAGGVQTADREGADGVVYRAFWVETEKPA